MNTKNWVARQAKDVYVKKKKESILFKEYYARSAFKLKEIQAKYKLFKPNQKVIDVGCSPGSFSQVLLEYRCKVIGYDLLECKLKHPDFTFYKKDITTIKEIENEFIVSDMSPNLTGNHVKDASDNIELNSHLLSLVCDSTTGLICKSFQSPLQLEFEELLRPHFKTIHKFKPKSSRQSSSEYYYIALNRK